MPGLPLVVAGLGAVLVAPVPGGPAQVVPGGVRGVKEEGGEEADDLAAGQRDVSAGCALGGYAVDASGAEDVFSVLACG